MVGVRAAAVALAAACAASLVAPAHAAENPPRYANPVVAANLPDPTVVRIGGEYWATTTGGNMTILRSTDLVHWTVAGSVFEERPSWSDGRLWAPELFRAGPTRYLMYYAGAEQGKRHCVRVAESDVPIGPFREVRSLVCQRAGSIDPAILRNTGGVPFLYWKEDRNTEGVPTVLWGRPLSADATHLAGSSRKVLVASSRGWEGDVVEAPFVFRRKGWVYMLYSANLCCGPKCEYAMGVARAKGLFGPFRRPKRGNPILESNDEWLCPGHGTAVQSPDGRWWLLYHSYDADDLDAGRQLLLDPIRWTRDGWPVVNRGRGPSGRGAPPSSG